MLKRYQFILFVLLLFVAWMGMNISTNLLLSSLSADISADKKYSLTKQTLNWLKTNTDNIYIRLYMGDLDKNPRLKKYATDIMLLLEEYQLASNGKISIKSVEVKPFSATEISARKAGIEGGEGKPWLGIVVSDEKGNFASIPFLNPDKKTYIEHDVTRMLSKLLNHKKATIGVMSSEISVLSSSNSLDYTSNWFFINQLKQDYNFKKISNRATVIDDDIDVLMIINPKLLREMTVYAIDQYLVRGGKIIVFMDPLSEAAKIANKNMLLEAPSGLEVWLFKMGVFYPFDMVLGSFANFTKLKTLDGKTVDYPFWVEVEKDNFEHSLLEGIKKLRFNFAAPLRLIERENIKQHILVSAGKMSGEQKVNLITKAKIADSISSFKSDDEQRLLAVLLEGKFNSLFAKPYLETEYYLTGQYAYRFLAENEGKVIVVADSDFLDAKLWDNKFKERSHNFDFVERMIDYLSNTNLISVEEKTNNTKNVTINGKLYDLAESYYFNQKKLAENKLLSVVAMQTDMYRKIESKELITSVVVANKLESLEKDKYQLRQQLNYIDYKIKNLYRIYFVMMIVMNILFSIFVLFVVRLIIKKKSSYLSKLAERIADDV